MAPDPHKVRARHGEAFTFERVELVCPCVHVGERESREGLDVDAARVRIAHLRSLPPIERWLTPAGLLGYLILADEVSRRLG